MCGPGLFIQRCMGSTPFCGCFGAGGDSAPQTPEASEDAGSLHPQVLVEGALFSCGSQATSCLPTAGGAPFSEPTAISGSASVAIYDDAARRPGMVVRALQTHGQEGRELLSSLWSRLASPQAKAGGRSLHGQGPRGSVGGWLVGATAQIAASTARKVAQTWWRQRPAKGQGQPRPERQEQGQATSLGSGSAAVCPIAGCATSSATWSIDGVAQERERRFPAGHCIFGEVAVRGLGEDPGGFFGDSPRGGPATGR